jgi:hypothetical protein
MRDIKFRAWDLEYRCMDTNFYIYPDGTVHCTAERTYDTPNTEIEQDYNLVKMQFTGLQDKNGVDIYEGDILKTESDLLVVKVWMGNNCLCFTGDETGIPVYPYNVNHSIEIIGNIHQNPELLETL